jgi:hypothetical protein
LTRPPRPPPRPPADASVADRAASAAAACASPAACAASIVSATVTAMVRALTSAWAAVMVASCSASSGNISASARVAATYIFGSSMPRSMALSRTSIRSNAMKIMGSLDSRKYVCWQKGRPASVWAASWTKTLASTCFSRRKVFKLVADTSLTLCSTQ